MRKFIFILILLSSKLFSQNLVTNDGLSVKIQNGMTVTIQGGFTNQTNITDGEVDNEGVITLTGDWVNNATNGVFTTNSGDVEFIGTANDQNISGTNSTSFYNVTTNNTFGTIPQLIVDIDTDIKNDFTMTSGVINLNTNRITLGVSSLSTGRLFHDATLNSGWMYDGDFRRYFSTTLVSDGSVDGLFPVGTDADFRPFYVSYPVTTTSTGGDITISHTNSVDVTNVSFMDDVMVTRRHDAFWTLTTNDMTDGVFNLRAEGTGFGVIGDVADLRLTLANSVVGTPGVNAGTTSNPIVNRIGLVTSEITNVFHISSIDGVDSPLPIELLSFYGYDKNNSVILEWITLTETNNSHFFIEKFINNEWKKIGKIDGSGNSNSINKYKFIDINMLDINYYRLWQVDYDGKCSVSKMIVVNSDKNNSVSIDVSIYSNPVKASDGGVYLVVKGLDDVMKIRLTSISGQILSERIFACYGQSSNCYFDFDGELSTGLYFLNFEIGGVIVSEKMIIK